MSKEEYKILSPLKVILLTSPFYVLAVAHVMHPIKDNVRVFAPGDILTVKDYLYDFENKEMFFTFRENEGVGHVSAHAFIPFPFYFN